MYKMVGGGKRGKACVYSRPMVVLRGIYIPGVPKQSGLAPYGFVRRVEHREETFTRKLPVIIEEVWELPSLMSVVLPSGRFCGSGSYACSW